MRVTLTPGTGSCNHLTIRNAATQEILYHATLAELKEESRSGDPLLMQMRMVIKQSGATTKAQARTAIEAAEFI